MDAAERAAAADAALAVIHGSDAPKPVSSEEPAAETVTPAQAEQPDEVAGSEASNGPPVEVPEWVPEGSKEAYKGLPSEVRQVVEARERSIMADATKKWMEAAEAKKKAKQWDDLVASPRAAKVLAAMDEAPQVDPNHTKLVEMLGEDAANAILGVMDTKVKAETRAVVDAPKAHKNAVLAAADEFRTRLGDRISDEEFDAAIEQTGAALGWRPDDPDAPYRVLTPENVSQHLYVALNAARAARSKAPEASPVAKPPASKPASVQSKGMAIESKAEPAWKREKRAPTMGEAAMSTFAKHGMTEADVTRLMRTM